MVPIEGEVPTRAFDRALMRPFTVRQNLLDKVVAA